MALKNDKSGAYMKKFSAEKVLHMHEPIESAMPYYKVT